MGNQESNTQQKTQKHQNLVYNKPLQIRSTQYSQNKQQIQNNQYNSNYGNNGGGGIGCYGCMANNNNNIDNLDLNELNLDYDTYKPRGRLTNNSIQYLSPNEIAFFKCSASKNISKVRFYLKQGVNINILDEERTSPLHVAVRHGSYQVIQVLLENGANVDITDIAGWTPLHISVFFQRYAVTELLLKSGANKYIKNRDDHTPFQLIQDQKTIEVFKQHEDMILSMPNSQRQSNFQFNSTQQSKQKQEDLQQQQLDGNINSGNIQLTGSNYETNNNIQNESVVMLPNLMSPRKHQYYLYFRSLKQKLTNEKSNYQSINIQEINPVSKFQSFKQQYHNPQEVNPGYNIITSANAINTVTTNNNLENYDENEFDENTMEEIQIEKRRNQFNTPAVKKFMVGQYQQQGQSPINLLNNDGIHIPNFEQFTPQQFQNYFEDNYDKEKKNDYKDFIDDNLNNNQIREKSFTPIKLHKRKSSVINKSCINQMNSPLHSPNPSMGSIFFVNYQIESLKNIIYFNQKNKINTDGYDFQQDQICEDSIQNQNNFNDFNNNPNQIQQNKFTIQQKSLKNFTFDYAQSLTTLFMMLVNIDILSGIAMLQLFQIIPYNNYQSLIEILQTNKIIEKSTLGYILTNLNLKEHTELIKWYLNKMDFSFLDFNSALRLFFSPLHVINDPEKIDILLQQFSQRYYSLNFSHKHYFTSIDSVHMLSFASIMLDIEVHYNRTLQIKNTINEFEQNIIGINDNRNIDNLFVTYIVDDIIQKQIIYLTDKDSVDKARIIQFQNFLKHLDQQSQICINIIKNSSNQKKQQKQKPMMLYLVDTFVILIQGSYETNDEWLRIFSILSLNISHKKSILKFKSSNDQKSLKIAKIQTSLGVKIQQKKQLEIQIQNKQDGDKLTKILFEQFSKNTEKQN